MLQYQNLIANFAWSMHQIFFTEIKTGSGHERNETLPARSEGK